MGKYASPLDYADLLLVSGCLLGKDALEPVQELPVELLWSLELNPVAGIEHENLRIRAAVLRDGCGRRRPADRVPFTACKEYGMRQRCLFIEPCSAE